MDKDFKILIEEAKKIVGEVLFYPYGKKGTCACALLTDKGNIYSGIAMDFNLNGLGCCAEQAAILSMLKHNEFRILKIVTLKTIPPESGDIDYVIYSPCGKCRELIRMVHADNIETLALVNSQDAKTIKELLPDMWVKKPT